MTSALQFACQAGCTKCCDQEGMVYLSEADVPRIAKYVGMTQASFEKKYLYRTRHRRRFRKPRDKQCPFLESTGCSIHAVKPVQCRTYPFWPELVEHRDIWRLEGRRCPGIGQGPLIQIGEAMEIAEEQRRAYPEQYKE